MHARLRVGHSFISRHKEGSLRMLEALPVCPSCLLRHRSEERTREERGTASDGGVTEGR